MAAPLSPEPLLSSLLADLTSDLDLTLFPPADVTTSGSGGLETEQHGEDGKKRARAKSGCESGSRAEPTRFWAARSPPRPNTAYFVARCHMRQSAAGAWARAVMRVRPRTVQL